MHTIRRTAMVLAALMATTVMAQPQRQDVESYRMARSLASRGDLDGALELLEAELERGFDPAQALADPVWMQARRDPRFKALIRQATVAAEASIAPHGEPGEPFVQIMKLRTATDTPVVGALVYAYQTDATGVYSPGDNDNRNPRLYAYARSDGDGVVRLLTIRPASYPSESVPQHIHYRIEAAGHAALEGEILFEDDPLLTAQARQRAERRGWPIARIGNAEATVRIEMPG